jgi:2-polyprenyl-3-methyl-5-hydroxy-6-metoxy-1,4-benzoquinol methylase
MNPFTRPTNVEMHNNKFRNARFTRFLGIVDDVASTVSPVRILDLGGTLDFWLTTPELWQGRDFHVTLINMFPQTPPDDRFTCVIGNACATDFADQSFDIVISNSVIEHVGRWRDMGRMANEIRRLAPRYFIQTPNYWFPLEAHSRFPLFHMMPEPWRIRLILARGTGFYGKANNLDEAMEHVENAILLDSKRFQHLFPDAVIERERVLGMTKSLIAIR